MANPTDFRLRPSGLAFSMLSPLAGQPRVPARIEGTRSVKLTRGKGNHPKGTTYPILSAVASRDGATLQVVILNRAFEGAERLTIDVRGAAVRSAEAWQLGPEAPDASNDEVAGRVRIRQRALSGEELRVLEVPPRSLLRLVYLLG